MHEIVRYGFIKAIFGFDVPRSNDFCQIPRHSNNGTI